MKSIIAGIVLLTSVFSVNAQMSPPQGGPYCAPSALLIGELLNEFKEVPQLTASDEVGNQTLVFFANKETGTWTIVIFNADMSSGCAVTSGKNYKSFKEGEFDKELKNLDKKNYF